MNPLLIFLCLSLCLTDQPQNPLQRDFNQLVAYENLTVAHIKGATDDALVIFDRNIEAIYKVPAAERTFANTVRALDDAGNQLFNVYGPINLLANTAPDDALRAACLDASSRFAARSNLISMDLQLFAAIEAYSQLPAAKTLKPDEARFLKKTLDDFKRSGLNLPEAQRTELQKIRDEIDRLSQDFEKNIAEFQDPTIFTEADLDGLDDAYKAQHRQEDGTYKIDLTYPSYSPFMAYATSESARKTLFLKYNNRAREKNLPILKQVLKLRKQLATLLGFDSYAEYALSSKLAENSTNVLAFENDLITALMPKHREEYALILKAKSKHLGKEATTIQPWESSFYSNKTLLEDFQVDQRLVKQYFEIGNVLKGLFMVTQKLMGVTFEKVENPSVWHKDVTLYKVLDNNKIMGYFYLDLHPRPNKYTHAACFPVVSGSRDTGQIPVATLVCNFPEASEGRPALMSHRQVNTFFHEFGHVLHNLLSEANLTGQFGTSVAGDFVEAPSQIFENWTWDYQTLSMFAFHHETGEPMPEDLFKKMLASRNVFSATQHLRQVYYGLLDLNYHHTYDPEGDEDTNVLRVKLEQATGDFPVLEETRFQASFGHLMGYGANYYGYLYSKVFSQDMFSVFEKEGILNEETGMRYRKTVLAGGDTQHPMELMKAFLGREPNNQAFARSLGL